MTHVRSKFSVQVCFWYQWHSKVTGTRFWHQ